MRRAFRDISSILILSGLLLLIDGGITVFWQEPVTAAIGMIQRANVDKQFLSYKTAPLTHTQSDALKSLKSSEQKIRYLAREDLSRIKEGDAIGTIDIPRIGHTYTLIQGTGTSQLEAGPGHYPGTALPGMDQTVGIAGHRTTYLAPFRFINELAKGDHIIVTMPYGTFTYVVQYHHIVLPNDVAVVDNVGYERLVLSACDPIYSATHRWIVFAKLQSTTPSAVDSSR
jgi:sortase A